MKSSVRIVNHAAMPIIFIFISNWFSSVYRCWCADIYTYSSLSFITKHQNSFNHVHRHKLFINSVYICVSHTLYQKKNDNGKIRRRKINIEMTKMLNHYVGNMIIYIIFIFIREFFLFFFFFIFICYNQKPCCCHFVVLIFIFRISFSSYTPFYP